MDECKNYPCQNDNVNAQTNGLERPATRVSEHRPMKILYIDLRNAGEIISTLYMYSHGKVYIMFVFTLTVTLLAVTRPPTSIRLFTII